MKIDPLQFNFDESTPPKEIVTFAMIEISELMKDDGFKFVKSRLEISKQTENFVFCLSSQSNRWNTKGKSVEIWIHCSVSDRKSGKGFWNKTLALSNSKLDQFHSWQLYGEENYKSSLKQITRIINFNLLPFFRRFEQDLHQFVVDVSKNGFCAFGEKQIYDAGYHIPIAFLEKYGTTKQMNIAFQNYIDRHELSYVKINMQKAMELLKDGKEVLNNGEKDYAELAFKNGLALEF